ncbi:substrate-binding periplasmic protein [Aeromonas australiensis]|uniref:substrate-binding periplasmic protein n=1 Tax=Aeromonas australiensis TaxID=1114880 RepID=UPI00058A3BE5|nr:transporter substrate-binding domain-containing protein [Aeromonas australiensis]
MNWYTCVLLFSLWGPKVFANVMCPEPIRVGYDNWPPYHYYDADSPQQVRGYAAAVLTAVLTSMHCQVNYVELPWKRVLHEMEYGGIDMAMEANINEDRARYAWFSDSYNPGRTLLWVRKGSHYNEEDLASWLAKGYSLGVTKEYFYGDEVMLLLARYAKQVSAVSDKQNVAKLARGRIDGFLGDALATPSTLEKEGMSGQFTHHPMVVYESPSFFMLSKRSFSLQFLQQFNQKLAALKGTDAYDIIWQRYASER